MSTNGKRPRYEEDSDETEASTPSSNGSVRQPQSNSQGLPSRLEPTIFGIFPTSDFTKQVGDFLYQNIDREYVEIEAKLGRLIDTRTRERIQLDVACETIVSPQRRNLKFESNMTEAQHKHFNEILNNRVVATKPPYQGVPLEYKHIFETDRVYQRNNCKVRVTTNTKTGQIVNGGIVEKVRIAVLNVHSPNTYLDYRITVNSEKPVEMPTGQHVHERNKDRLSYTHQLFKVDLTQVKGPEKSRNVDGTMPPQDLSHELEVEFINPQILIEEKNKLTQQQHNRYVNIVENFLNNIRCLAKEAQIP
ncbi:hypothetical protein Glove_227g42 [Diversispora epigaea]|uniref:mRNA-capping enzyme subunit beta n=1 Tax=Diversispora epigaea TaxID=1348612 RepID=A0A397ILN1_9GLOM|nr:hypothetical protein Glove_227g42 [Diversispora epigaea]